MMADVKKSDIVGKTRKTALSFHESDQRILCESSWKKSNNNWEENRPGACALAFAGFVPTDISGDNV
jgi:hypothetical protein